ncbi:hypothetical protein [Microbispora bryophytorum]|uniref:hypothetical protein n=1 Tax=Microbispora bryophytorum TaxID=1460882 RepID=UPI0033F7C648
MRQQDQFIHLVRLAWDLHMRGVSAAVDLPKSKEPTLVLPRTVDTIKIMALLQNGQWFFTWGRGREQRVSAMAEEAAERVWELAQ